MAATGRSTTVRDAVAADFPAILVLNEESVRFLSPLDAPRLARLHRQSACHRVVEGRQGILGFLLAFADGAEYDSPNYQWFAARYSGFLYIDRVVVARTHQNRGIGALLYTDLFAIAGSTGIARVTCEFDLEPPNPRSARFHRRYGFGEVGRQELAGSGKVVSLQAVMLPSSRGTAFLPL